MKYSLIKRFSYSLLVLILLSIVPSLSFGQWILGAKAGYNFTKITGGGVYGGMNNKSGFEIGAVISKKLKVDFAFESGIFYSMAGVNQKFIQVKKESSNNPTTNDRISKDSTFRISNTLSLNYVKIPLMLRKSFSIKGSNLYPYKRKISITDIDIMIGPYVSYLLSASASYSNKVSVVTKVNDLTTSTEPEKGLTDDYHKSFQIGFIDSTLVDSRRPSLSKGLNKFDVGITASLGVSFELSTSTKLMVGGNYSMGLLTIDKTYFNDITPGVDSQGNPVTNVTKKDLKNSSMGVYLAWVKYLK